MTKKLQKTQKNEVANPLTPSRGFDDNVSSEDYLLPRLELLQALSPTVQEEKGKAGELVNSITKRKVNTTFIPVRLEKTFIRWIPRSEGGGIEYRTNNPLDPRVIEDTKWKDGDKPLCTAYLNFLCLAEGEDTPIVVSFANTSYTAGRKLLTMARMRGGDLFSRKYKVSSVKKTNNLGTFFVLNVEEVGPVTSDEFARAESLYNAFSSKEIKFEQDANKETVDDSEVSNEF